MTKVLVCLQYADEARQLWQSALTACTPYTDVSLILQAHKLLHTPGAIAAALSADDPQQSLPTPAARPNGIATVRFLTHTIVFANACKQHSTLSKKICLKLCRPDLCLHVLLLHMQAAPVRSTENGAAGSQIRQAAEPPPVKSGGQPTSMPDPSAAIGLAVTQINNGRFDEADKLLSGIINETDKRTPNLGAHVARGTARALRRELQGTAHSIHWLSETLIPLHDLHLN